MQTMTIGRLAERAGVNVDTVRYYERDGLLPPPARRASGYREYAETDVERLRFIRRAKHLGFTLAEIRELLALSLDRSSDMHAVKRRAERRLEQVRSRIEELRRVERGLEALVEACPGHGELARCPIVAALNDDAPDESRT